MSGAAHYEWKKERRRRRAVLDLPERHRGSERSTAGKTKRSGQEQRNGRNGRTDGRRTSREGYVSRGAGLSTIDECQVTMKVVEEYESAQTRPLLQVGRDRSN